VFVHTSGDHCSILVYITYLSVSHVILAEG